jgi:hypothetical protein
MEGSPSVVPSWHPPNIKEEVTITFIKHFVQCVHPFLTIRRGGRGSIAADFLPISDKNGDEQSAGV